MFKLFKRLTAREVSMIVLSVLFTFLTVYLELEVPTYISTITELLAIRILCLYFFKVRSSI